MLKAEAAMKKVGEGSVKYRFKTSLHLGYSNVTFSGTHITVAELRKSIMQFKRIDPNSDYELRLSNSSNHRVYNYDHALIPSGTTVIVSRVRSSDKHYSFISDMDSKVMAITKNARNKKEELENDRDEWSSKIGRPIFYQYDPYISTQNSKLDPQSFEFQLQSQMLPEPDMYLPWFNEWPIMSAKGVPRH